MNTLTITLFYARQLRETQQWLEAREDGVEQFDDDILVSLYRNENATMLYVVTFPLHNAVVQPITDRVKVQELLCEDFWYTSESAYNFAYTPNGQLWEIALLQQSMHFLFLQDVNASFHGLKYRGKAEL